MLLLDVELEKMAGSNVEIVAGLAQEVLLLRAIARSTIDMSRGPSCWCEAAIGHPLYPDHSSKCKTLAKAFKDWASSGLPTPVQPKGDY